MTTEPLASDRYTAITDQRLIASSGRLRRVSNIKDEGVASAVAMPVSDIAAIKDYHLRCRVYRRNATRR